MKVRCKLALFGRQVTHCPDVIPKPSCARRMDDRETYNSRCAVRSEQSLFLNRELRVRNSQENCATDAVGEHPTSRSHRIGIINFKGERQ